MLRPAVRLLGLFIFTAVFAWQAGAQDKGPGPVWVQGTGYALGEGVTGVDVGGGQVVAFGDPALGRWAIRQASRARKMKVEDLLNWLRVVELYRVTEVNPTLLGMIGRLDLKENDGSAIPWRLFAAAAATATPKTADKLERLLQALDKMPPDDNTRKRADAKMQLAAALVRLDEDAGRDYLLDQFKKGVPKDRSDKQYDYSAVQTHLKSIGDKALNETLAGFQGQIGFANKTQTITALLYRMELNRQPMDALWKIAEEESGASKEREYTVKILAERAPLEDLGRLRNLRLNGTGISTNPRTIQRIKEDWNELHAYAVMVMRSRLWRELGK